MGNKLIIEEYIGKKYRRLTIISDAGIGKYGARLVKCKCDCGNVKDINLSRLISKTFATRSCGCLLREKKYFELLKKNDYPGKTLGKLKIISDLGVDAEGHRIMNCRCICGNVCQKKLVDLLSGKAKTCGCNGKKDPPRSKCKSSMPEYASWMAMKTRCYNPKYEQYHRYGGRGIKVCDRWLNSFENFLEDVGERPTNKHTIDRIDGDKDYSPDNCRWATKKEQNRNQYTTIFYDLYGKKVTAKEVYDAFVSPPIAFLAFTRLLSKGRVTMEEAVDLVNRREIHLKSKKQNESDFLEEDAIKDIFLSTSEPKKILMEKYNCSRGCIKNIQYGRWATHITKYL